MAFCPQCGGRNPDGSRFCAECGSAIPTLTAPARPAHPQPPQPVYTPPAYAQPPQPQPNYAPPAYTQPPQPQPNYAPPTYTQPSMTQPPQAQPIYTPPYQPSYTQPPYAPPVQPVYEPPISFVSDDSQKPRKSFPWGIVIVLALLAVLVVGCLIADIVSDGEFNLFGILESDDRDRDRDDDDDEEDDDDYRRDPDADSDSVGTTPPPQPVPTAPPAAEEPPMPAETIAPTEPAAELQYYDIRIWTSEAIADLTLEHIAQFNETNPYGIYFDAVIETISEGDAASVMTSDIAAGADLYCFAQDQTARLVQAGALSAPDQAGSSFIFNQNDAGAVNAASLYGTPYAYPLTSDNGYFMYYNKSILSETDVESLESIIAACENSGTRFCFELENAWYMTSFFFATGCRSQWIMDDSGQFIGVDDNFFSEQGFLALEGMKKLLHSPCYYNSSGTWEFQNGAAVVVSGIWNYANAAEILGDNLGVADLPSFEVDGISYHLGSFNGCKLMGVKPQSDPDKEAALHLLAQHLTGEECQMDRYHYADWGPSNLNAQQSEEVQSSPALAALLQQAAYSVPQGQIHGSWWDIAKNIAIEVRNGTDPWAALEIYQVGLEELLW